jgi:hypothetical protein
MPFHTMTTKGKSFHLGKMQKREFEYLQNKISDYPVLAMTNLQWPFELETDANRHAFRAILMQGGSPRCYHS